jgi:hypothetical protein
MGLSHGKSVNRMNHIPIAGLILTFLICIVNSKVVVTRDTDTNDHHDHDHKPAHDDDTNPSEPLKLYGTEVSWPMQQLPPLPPLDDVSATTSTATKYPTYEEYMNGCYEAYDIKTCQHYDAERIQRNNIQPKIVHKNYTRAGYAKIVAPSTTFSLLRDYWNRYSTTHLQFEIDPEWRNGGGSTTTTTASSSGTGLVNLHMNHWVAPTKILYLDPPVQSRHIPTPPPQMSISNIHTMMDQIQSVLEQWTGVPLQFTSMYGIRSYTNHSILTPHIDRYVRKTIYFQTDL